MSDSLSLGGETTFNGESVGANLSQANNNRTDERTSVINIETGGSFEFMPSAESVREAQLESTYIREAEDIAKQLNSIPRDPNDPSQYHPAHAHQASNLVMKLDQLHREAEYEAARRG